MNEEVKFREPTIPTDLFHSTFFGVNMGEKLGAVEARLIQVDKDISELKGEFKNLNAKVDGLTQAFARLDARLTAQDARLTAQEERFNDKLIGLESRVNEKFAAVNDKFSTVNDKFASLEKRLESSIALQYGILLTLLATIVIQKFI